MDFDDRGVVDEIRFPGVLRRPRDAETAVGALYQAHALGLIRPAHVMLGDRPAAEDVVQEAFRGLYRPEGPERSGGDVMKPPIEDRVRAAIQASVREIPPTAPPPLTLPQRRPRRSGRPGWRA